MLQEAYFICVSAQCQQDRILNDWESIMAHQNQGHEVLEKEDLINTINVKLNKKKTTLLQDLLARIHKIMINQEDALISLINQRFFESYTNWKEQIQSYQQFQDYLLPNQIDQDTTITKLIDIYQNLDNEQLHFFKDCLYQTEQQYISLQTQIKISLNKTDQEFKMLQQSLFNQIQENKRQRELKLQFHQNNRQIITFQNTQPEILPIQQKDIIIKNTTDIKNTLKEVQLKNDFQIQKEILILEETNQQREQHQKNHFDRQENNLTINNNNNKLNEKTQKYIVLTKQKEARKNQHLEQYSNIKQNSEELIQNQKSYSDTQYIKQSENIIKDNKQLTDIIAEIKILPLKGYKDHQQQQNSIVSQRTQSVNGKDQIDQSITKVNEIVHQSSISPPKPPPLKGYKDRQNEEQKIIKLARSNDKRNYLDNDQIKEIQQNTSKRFDIDKSEKHMKYSNKFSTIFSIKECFAVIDGVFKLTDYNQFHIYLRSSVDYYEIEVGMVNLTQIKLKYAFPSVYGINKKGECLSNQTNTQIKLNLNQSYLFAYRKEEKNLICLDQMKNIQYAIQLPNDENSDYVFFIKMSNLEVQLI